MQYLSWSKYMLAIIYFSLSILNEFVLDILTYLNFGTSMQF